MLQWFYCHSLYFQSPIFQCHAQCLQASDVPSKLEYSENFYDFLWKPEYKIYMILIILKMILNESSNLLSILLNIVKSISMIFLWKFYQAIVVFLRMILNFPIVYSFSLIDLIMIKGEGPHLNIRIILKIWAIRRISSWYLGKWWWR